MKKILSLTVVIVLVLLTAVTASAYIQDTNEFVSKGHYFVIKTAPAGNVFDPDGGSNGTMFKWGLSSFLEEYDEGVKIKAGSAGELTVGYGSAGILGIETEEDTFVTEDLKFFGMRYKTAETCNVGVKFMIPGTDADWDSWNSPDYAANYDFPASEEYTIVCFELPATMQFSENPYLMGWECQSAPADVYVTDICFFASEDEARNFAENYEELSTIPETTETDPPATEPRQTENPGTKQPEESKNTPVVTSSTPTTPATDNETASEGLTTGAMIGIIAAVTAVVVIVIVIIAKKKK